MRPHFQASLTPVELMGISQGILKQSDTLEAVDTKVEKSQDISALLLLPFYTCNETANERSEGLPSGGPQSTALVLCPLSTNSKYITKLPVFVSYTIKPLVQEILTFLSLRGTFGILAQFWVQLQNGFHGVPFIHRSLCCGGRYCLQWHL